MSKPHEGRPELPRHTLPRPYRHRLRLLAAVALCVSLSGLSPAAMDRPTHDWFSLAVEVRDVPEGAGGVPVSTFVDFSQALQEAGIRGTVDGKSLRLFRRRSRSRRNSAPGHNPGSRSGRGCRERLPLSAIWASIVRMRYRKSSA
jgi:hypothetical protein